MDSMHQTTDTPPDRATIVPDPRTNVPDRADDLRDLGEWIGRLAGALGRMPQQQRRALLHATDALKGDLQAIRLGVPEVKR